MKTGGGLEKMDQLRDQFEPLLAHQVFDRSQVGFKRNFAIARFQHYASIVAGLNTAMRTKRSGEIQSGRARVKEVKGPNVDRASGKIDACRGRRFN